MTEKTKITKQEYYAALGCLLAAKDYADRSSKFQSEMCNTLNFEGDYAGHVSDLVYEDLQNPIEEFDAALVRENIEVEDDAGRDSQAAEVGSGAIEGAVPQAA